MGKNLPCPIKTGRYLFTAVVLMYSWSSLKVQLDLYRIIKRQSVVIRDTDATNKHLLVLSLILFLMSVNVYIYIYYH